MRIVRSLDVLDIDLIPHLEIVELEEKIVKTHITLVFFM